MTSSSRWSWPRKAAMAKEELGFSLGVFAPMSEHDRMDALGVDYIVTEDFRGSDD